VSGHWIKLRYDASRRRWGEPQLTVEPGLSTGMTGTAVATGCAPVAITVITEPGPELGFVRARIDGSPKPVPDDAPLG
jgi:hypothetical protein